MPGDARFALLPRQPQDGTLPEPGRGLTPGSRRWRILCKMLCKSVTPPLGVVPPAATILNHAGGGNEWARATLRPACLWASSFPHPHPHPRCQVLTVGVNALADPAQRSRGHPGPTPQICCNERLARIIHPPFHRAAAGDAWPVGTRGVPNRSRTCGQAVGRIIQCLLDCGEGLAHQQVRRIRKAKVLQRTQGAGERLSCCDFRPSGVADDRCYPHPVRHRAGRPARR